MADSLALAAARRRTIGVKKNPQTSTFARVSLYFKDKHSYTLQANEFEFILATAIQTIHGDVANKPDILAFEPIDAQCYKAVIRFPTINYTRVVTSLILFGHWKDTVCKFEIDRLAQTPCFLSI